MKNYISIFLFAIPLFIYYMLYKAHHDKISDTSIYDEKLPTAFEGLRIFFISDIHRRRIKDSTLKAIGNNVDIVVIGGDLTEKHVPLNRTKNNLSKLRRWNVPIYFVWGNNDYEIDVCGLSNLLEQENVTILTNDSSNVRRDNAVISIVGLDCATYHEPDVELARKNAQGTYQILVTHIPNSFYKLDQSIQNQFNLVLSGHTHGGQMRLFGLGPYERGSLNKIRNTNILVSEGYGYTILPFRIGTNAECHILTLQR
ncbi:metallophosphoesterase [Oceanobacillus bengalensis]|uniref:Metallophosphoesterase n=1 Tax=Oceanobacillus bengalensis TaxID=1435466 RepID=A0A494Z0Y3_9BACI|nr:metallophosphoesterase [Oceanobacillus bengalensis]RKQ16120.1 metallophosphoesterase [Oceanobacillus bengalensis]